MTKKCTTKALAALTGLLTCRTPDNRDSTDETIWDEYGQTAAILYTDLAGFSKTTAQKGIIDSLEVVFAARRRFGPIVARFGGHTVKHEADSMLVLLDTIQEAMECALELFEDAREYNRTIAKDFLDEIRPCVGISYGPFLMIGEHELFGQPVNMACKLGEDLAKPWEILVADPVVDELEKHEVYRFEEEEKSPLVPEHFYRLVL